MATTYPSSTSGSSRAPRWASLLLGAPLALSASVALPIGLPMGLVIGLPIALAGCGGSSSSGGGGGASTTSAATSTAGSSAASTAQITSLRTGGGPLAGVLHRGDVSVTFALIDPSGASSAVSLSVSVDGGATWAAATLAGRAPTALASGPAPGIEHTLVWTSASDVAAFAPDVRLRVSAASAASGGSAVAASTSSFAVDNEALSTQVHLNRRPYLQSTDQTSTVIAWRTTTALKTTIEWGPTVALGQSLDTAADEDHDVRLTGLTAGTRYFYRLTANGQALTPRIPFRSAPASGEVRLIVFGDSGMANQPQRDVAKAMAAEDADLILHTGDVIYPIGALMNPVTEYNERFFHIYEDMLEDTPIFPVVGNHDLYGLGGRPFKRAFFLPSNGQGSLLDELYYSFEWGDCKFIGIESNALFKSPLGPHMSWFLNELASNTKKWLILFMHEPLYSAGKHGDSTLLQSLYGHWIETHGVDLLLAGHDHNYERTIPIKQFNQDPTYPGLVHIVTGSAAKLRPMTPNQRTAVSSNTYGYVRLRTDGDLLHGEAVDITGQVIDSFSVREH